MHCFLILFFLKAEVFRFDEVQFFYFMVSAIVLSKKSSSFTFLIPSPILYLVYVRGSDRFVESIELGTAGLVSPSTTIVSTLPSASTSLS